MSQTSKPKYATLLLKAHLVGAGDVANLIESSDSPVKYKAIIAPTELTSEQAGAVLTEQASSCNNDEVKKMIGCSLKLVDSDERLVEFHPCDALAIKFDELKELLSGRSGAYLIGIPELQSFWLRIDSDLFFDLRNGKKLLSRALFVAGILRIILLRQRRIQTAIAHTPFMKLDLKQLQRQLDQDCSHTEVCINLLGLLDDAKELSSPRS